MTHEALLEQIKAKKSFLCVGLDVDKELISGELKSQPDSIFIFCKKIIEATAPYCVAYKPILPFLKLMGWKVGNP